jgi:hypothetical protein
MELSHPGCGYHQMRKFFNDMPGSLRGKGQWSEMIFSLIPPLSFIDELNKDFSRIPLSLFRYAYYKENFINYSLKNIF